VAWRVTAVPIFWEEKLDEVTKQLTTFDEDIANLLTETSG
jgi:hypothetical protein